MRYTLKTILTITLIATSACSFAAYRYKDRNLMYKDTPVSLPPTLLDGAYFGVQAGYDAFNINPDARGIGGNNANYDYYTKGFVGGVLAGYGRYFSNLAYLGGEIFLNYSTADESDNFRFASINGTAGFYKGTANINAEGGISLLPGYKLSDTTLGYARIGWNAVGLKYQESARTIGSVGANKVQYGLVLGLGLETLIVDSFSIRGEYTYTDYGSFNVSMGSGSSTGVDVSNNQFMLALLYHLSL